MSKPCKVCGSTTEQHKMSCYPHDREMAELAEEYKKKEDEATQINRDSEILPQ